MLLNDANGPITKAGGRDLQILRLFVLLLHYLGVMETLSCDGQVHYTTVCQITLHLVLDAERVCLEVSSKSVLKFMFVSTGLR
jgi:hypothetical protein